MALRLVVITFALLTALTAQAEDGVSASVSYGQLVNQAIAAQQAGEFKRARTLFAEAHALEPNARTLRGMGVAAFQAGDLQQSVMDLSASLEHPIKPLDGELRGAVLALLAEASAKLQSENALRVVTTEVSPPGAEPTAAPQPSASAPAQPQQNSLTLAVTASETAQEQDLRRASRASLAVSGLFAIGAGAMWTAGALRANRIEDSCATACSDEFVNHEVDRAGLRRMEMGFNVLAGSAAVALATSFGLWLWRGQVRKHNGQLAVGGTGLSYTGSF